jgi:hypothetical protein
MWTAALLALVLGAGQLVAYQGIAPHAHAMLSNRSGHAVLQAGRIVARDLSALAVRRARQAADDLVLAGLEGTSSLYRFAQATLGVTRDGSCGATHAGSCGGTIEMCEEPASCPEMDPGATAVTASEPDSPCSMNPECEAVAGSAHMCPPCPACPQRGVRSASRSALPRVLMIVGF